MNALDDTNITIHRFEVEGPQVIQYSAVGRYRTYRCGVSTHPRQYNESVPKTLGSFTINAAPYWGWYFVPSSIPPGETIQINGTNYKITHNNLRRGTVDCLSSYYFRAEEQPEPEPDA